MHQGQAAGQRVKEAQDARVQPAAALVCARRSHGNATPRGGVIDAAYGCMVYATRTAWGGHRCTLLQLLQAYRESAEKRGQLPPRSVGPGWVGGKGKSWQGSARAQAPAQCSPARLSLLWLLRMALCCIALGSWGLQPQQGGPHSTTPHAMQVGRHATLAVTRPSSVTSSTCTGYVHSCTPHCTHQ